MRDVCALPFKIKFINNCRKPVNLYYQRLVIGSVCASSLHKLPCRCSTHIVSHLGNEKRQHNAHHFRYGSIFLVTTCHELTFPRRPQGEENQSILVNHLCLNRFMVDHLKPRMKFLLHQNKSVMYS